MKEAAGPSRIRVSQSPTYYKAWAARNRDRLRVYRTEWARKHYKSRARTKKCEQLLCNEQIPMRRHYCDEDRHANRLWSWSAQNNKRLKLGKQLKTSKVAA